MRNGLVVAVCVCAAGFGAAWAQGAERAPATIVCPNHWAGPEGLAAREVQRYLYLRTGILLPIRADFGYGQAIVVAQKDDPFLARMTSTDAFADSWSDLGPDDYILRTNRYDGRTTLLIVGGSGTSTLYGAYRFAEHLGVRFYLHGDSIPDARIRFEIPRLDERRAPLFALRGIQPFHDFPEGPDWWNEDDYKAIVAQLPKLGMNFIGLHTYPVVEPTVWIGRSEDIGPDGRVHFSYPARYFNTALTVGWGFSAKKTSDYACGAGALFDRDDYSSDVMRDLTPEPATPAEANEMFNRVGALFNEVFTFARDLGVKTCIGTETPLVVPEPVRERADRHPDAGLYYEGVFRRIMAAHPLDYYWFWTPEGWTWEGVKEEQVGKTVDDILAAREAARRVGAPFRLATCGWVLGPQYDRAYLDKVLPDDIAVSCINRAVGHDPVEPAFAEVEGRDQWAIPWLEDDPAMTSMQLWAGRMRRDARDALRYGCNGLMGIHWRTRILGPNVAALAQAAWSQDDWPEAAEAGSGVIGGKTAAYDGTDFAGTDDDPLYRTVRYDLSGYRIVAPNGAYRVTLRLCEPHYREAGKRVFGIKLEGRQVVQGLDIAAQYGPDRAVDLVFEDVEVADGVLDIEFTREVELPCIAAFAVEGDGFSLKVDCGGPGHGEYQADLDPAHPHPPADDFYADWALAEFGPEVAEAAAAVFSRVDGRLPRPSDWIGGPGGYVPDPRPWDEVAPEYAFVDDFAALRDRVHGPGHRERFDYWLSNMEFLRATGRMRCVWARYNAALEAAKAQQDPAPALRESVLPLRSELMRAVEAAYGHLLATVNTAGAMGTVCNLEQHTFPSLIDAPAAELETLLGEPLPADAQLVKAYAGTPRLFVPTVRTVVRRGEDLTVRAVLLNDAAPVRMTLRWRPLGGGTFGEAPMSTLGRNTCQVTLAHNTLDHGVEYWVEAETADGTVLRWPATAPDTGQTVVVAP